MNNPKKWIWIRGLSRGSVHWGDFVLSFKKMYPNDDVEFIDLPGNGENYKLSSPLKIKDYVESVRSQSEFLKEHQQIRILAMSLGAMVATCWAEMYPHEIEKLVLVTTSSKGFCPFYKRLRLEAMKSLFIIPFILDLPKLYLINV